MASTSASTSGNDDKISQRHDVNDEKIYQWQNMMSTTTKFPKELAPAQMGKKRKSTKDKATRPNEVFFKKAGGSADTAVEASSLPNTGEDKLSRSCVKLPFPAISKLMSRIMALPQRVFCETV